MISTSKIQHKGQVTIPTHIRRQVGLSKGDLVEFSLSGGKIVITPMLEIDRSQFLNADDEYTPEQRRSIDAQLDEAEKGPTHGPFRNADEAISFLRNEIKARTSKQPRSG